MTKEFTAPRSSTGAPAGEEATVQDVAALLEQAARLLHGVCHHDGLVPAQWMALRYFARARGRERTVAGLMRYQNLDRSPVARTVRLLVERGLLVRSPNPHDRRADIIELSPRGRTTLESDPTHDLEGIVATLPPDQSRTLARALRTTVDAMRRSVPLAS
jgi:DNA-binding MarR family transcriptional regulator